MPVSNPYISNIDRGNAAVSGTEITVGVTLTTDASDTNEYYVTFIKDPSSTSNRHIKPGQYSFGDKTVSGQNYKASATTKINAIDDPDGATLIIKIQLYQKAIPTDLPIGQPIAQSITFLDLDIVSIASLIYMPILTAYPSAALVPDPGISPVYSDSQYNQITVNIEAHLDKLDTQQRLGVDITFEPLPTSGSLFVWSSLRHGTNLNEAKAATRLGNYFTVILSQADYEQSLYITSKDPITTKVIASNTPLSPNLFFVDVDQLYVEYDAPQPVNLIGNSVTVPAGQSSVSFDIDPDALSAPTGSHLFWMALNGNQIVYNPTDLSNIDTTISVPVMKLNTTDNPPENQTNRLQYFIQDSATGAISSSEYCPPFYIISQFQNEPDPTISNRPYNAPKLHPTPDGGIPQLIDLNYINVNDGASGLFSNTVVQPTGDITVNVYINGWDAQGNPKRNTIHPEAEYNYPIFNFKLNQADLIGYGSEPGHNTTFSTIKIEYYISNTNNINYGKYSQIASYYIDTLYP